MYRRLFSFGGRINRDGFNNIIMTQRGASRSVNTENTLCPSVVARVFDVDRTLRRGTREACITAVTSGS